MPSPFGRSKGKKGGKGKEEAEAEEKQPLTGAETMVGRGGAGELNHHDPTAPSQPHLTPHSSHPPPEPTF